MDTGQSTAAAPPAPRPSPALRELAWGTSAALVSVLAAAWRVGAPASLGGLWGHWDYTTVYALARTFAGGGWIGPNEDLGYPFVQDLAGFPSPDFVHLTALKALAVATGDPTIATNLFILLSFAAVAAAGYALLRVVRSPAPLAFALAVSLALVPWHFDRFQHVFLANYSSALLGLILVVAVLSWNLALSGPDRGRPRHLLIGLALACYVGLAGAYYAVFITILALVTLDVSGPPRAPRPRPHPCGLARPAAARHHPDGRLLLPAPRCHRRRQWRRIRPDPGGVPDVRRSLLHAAADRRALELRATRSRA